MQTTYLPPNPAAEPPPPPTAPIPTEPPPPPPRRRPVARAAALAALLAVAAGVGGVAGAVVADNDAPAGSPAAATVVRDTSPAASTGAAGSIETAAARIAPSVVTIQVQTSGDGLMNPGGSATGSGVIIRADGHILTNNHVVSAAASGGSIEVTFNDGRTASAEVVGRDPSTDLAVIKVQNVSGLVPATFADSAQLRIGQSVIAVGAPLGLSNTVTSGIVSAVDRPVRTGESGVDPQSAVIDAVQTDAPINPGNSGGPLVDLAGRVVGINSAIATVGSESGAPGGADQSGNIGVGFAIPANDAANIAEQLIADGTAEHASLGVQASDTAGAGGATIRQVTAGSAADTAGLRAGDVVTAVGDRAVTDVDSLVVAIRDHRPGDQVQITYRRGDAEATATVKLGAR